MHYDCISSKLFHHTDIDKKREKERRKGGGGGGGGGSDIHE